jgi:alpha-tubulin suppressor-like RCC1 family protein
MSTVKATGSNDKYQLGIPVVKRDHVQRTFTEIPALKSKSIIEIKCWNFSACIDEKKNLYVWGALISSQTSDQKPSALCIKQPEQVSSLKVSNIEIGQSMAFAIEHKT